jgi:hypothetical protein
MIKSTLGSGAGSRLPRSPTASWELRTRNGEGAPQWTSKEAVQEELPGAWRGLAPHHPSEDALARGWVSTEYPYAGGQDAIPTQNGDCLPKGTGPVVQPLWDCQTRNCCCRSKQDR